MATPLTTRCRTCRNWIATPAAGRPASFWACPKCGNDVRSAPKPPPSTAGTAENKEFGFFSGILAVPLAAVFAAAFHMFFPFAVLALAVVLVAVLVADSWRGQLAASKAAGHLAGRYLATPVTRLEIALGCVAAGIALVVGAQAVLWATGTISPDTVRAAERELSSLRALFDRWIGPGTLLIGMAVSTLIAMIAPSTQALRRFGIVSDVVGRTFLVLITLSSFTFFGATVVRDGEEAWTASLRTTLAQHQKTQGDLARDIAAAAWVEQRVADVSDDERAAMAAYLAPERESARRDPSSHPNTVARNLAFGAPKLTAPEVPPAGAATAAAEPRTSPSTTVRPDAAPTVRELEKVVAAQAVETSRLETLRTAAVSAAATALAQLVPGLDGGAAQALVKGLVSSLATEVGLDATKPRFASLAEARTWVSAAVTTARATPAEAAAVWRWTRADFALDRPDQPTRREAARLDDVTAARQKLVGLLTFLAAQPGVDAADRAALEEAATKVAAMSGLKDQESERLEGRRWMISNPLSDDPAERTRSWMESEFKTAGASALLAGLAGMRLSGAFTTVVNRTPGGFVKPPPLPPKPPKPQVRPR